MSAPKFTPGPWEAVTNPHDGTAEVRHVTARHDNGKAKAVTTVAYATCAGTTEGTANARLLAAAPELYAALLAATEMIAQDAAQRCEAEVRKYGKIPDYIAERIASFRAALAKAEGGGS